ncbi:MAG: lysyl oxidase family protein [Acidimicrobiales bacterium]
MRRTVMTMAIAMAAVALVALPPAGAATPRLPDLGMASLADFRIETPPGQRLLRFTALVVNVGAGPFDLKGVRKNTTVTEMRVKQRLFNDDGTKSTLATSATMFYAGDGHDHWHVRDLQRYTIHSIGTDTELSAGAKTGFCFFDGVAYRLSLPRAPQRPRYSSCGASASTTVSMGLSVGWGDVYPWNLAFQWIDISALPAGDYIVRAKADPKGLFTEASKGNNATWTKIRIGATNQVTVLEQGPAA